MSDRNLQLLVKFAALDKFTAPMRQMLQGSKATGSEVKALRDKIKQLDAQSSRIDGFRKLSGQTAVVRAQLQQAQDRVRMLAQEMRNADKPSVALSRSFDRARKDAGALKTQLAEMQQRLQRSREALGAAGIGTDKLSEHQRRLRTELAGTNKQLDEQKAKLEKAAKAAARQRAARADYDRGIAVRDKIAGAGVSAGIAGAAAAVPVVKAVREFSSLEDAMLGVAKQVEGARDANGKLTPTYYQMRSDIQAIGRVTPMATTEIAALTEGAARMGIQGRENLLAFTRTAAMSATAFELPADQVAEDMGKIANLYKIPIKNVEQLGDTINWLDDNAQSKGSDIINVMQRMGGVADKLNYKNAAALGSTFLSLGANAEVAASASNAMVRELSIATMQSKRFQTGMETIGLRSEDIEKAMAKDAMGTIQMVLEKIKKLNAEDQMRVTTQLFGKEYGDDAAKLANNMDELRRQIGLVNDEKARGSMGREASAKNDTLSAQQQMAANRMSEAWAKAGETLRPTLMSISTAFANVLDRVNAWMQSNPGLTSAIMHGVAAFSALLLTFAGVAAAVATALGPMLMFRFALASLGGGAQIFATMANLMFKGFGVIGNTLLWIGKALLWIGKALLWIARLAWAHPLLALIAAVAAGAIYIWQNWDTIGPMFFALLERVKAYFAGAWEYIKTQATAAAQWIMGQFNNLVSWFSALPGRMVQIGADMIKGIITGITSQLEALKATVVGAASSAASWFRQKLDIHSPSRVFALMGRQTLQGYEQGVLAQQGGTESVLGGLVDKILKAFPIVRRVAAMGVAALPALASAMPQLDTRPPLRASTPAIAQQMAAASGSSYAAPVINITINAAPGQDEQQLAKLVAREIEKQQRQAAARARGRMSDRD